MFCWYSLEIYAANPSRISLLFALYHSRWHTGRFQNQVGYQSFKPQRSFNSLVFMHWFIYRHFLNALHIDIPVTMDEDASKTVCESFRCPTIYIVIALPSRQTTNRQWAGLDRSIDQSPWCRTITTISNARVERIQLPWDFVWHTATNLCIS